MKTETVPHRSHRPSPLLSCALLALAIHVSHCFAQADQTTPSAAYFRIAGHVVSASDGRPLAGAKLQLLDPKDSKSIASTIAGQDGEFAFANLKSGVYYALEGSASGYIASRYDAHGRYSTAIINGDGIDTESLVLKLTPEAVLYGRVTDEAGDAVRRASMALYRESSETGITRTTRAGSALTDDTGAYEIAHLPPGKYFLSATATPWYAVHPQATPQPGRATIVDSVDPSLDVAYPVTFYPYATDSSGASPIPLKAGDQREIDIRLAPLPAMTITIPHALGNDLPPPPSGDRAAQMAYARAMQPPQIQLQRKVFDTLEPVPTETRFSSTAMSIIGVPPGQYVVQEQAVLLANIPADPEAPARFAKSATVDLTSRNAEIDIARGTASGKVKLQLKTPDGSKLPPRLTVRLERKDPKLPAVQGLSNDKDEVAFASVDPGEYFFVLTQGNKRYFVTKLVAEGKPMPDTLLHVTAGATTSMTVIADATTGDLDGFARNNGKPAPGARVVLLPEDIANRTRFIWEDQTDLDGSFHLKGIPPGHYTLVAIQDGWEIEWQREGAFDHYLALGTPIVIPNAANSSLKVPTPIAVQPR